MNDATVIALLLEDLDDSEDLYECYGETWAQYRYEMGRFGDAWPGSYDQISSMEAALDDIDWTRRLVNAISPPWGCHVNDPGWNHPLIEEPF